MKKRDYGDIKLAIVIPMYNEADNIKTLISQIKTAVTKTNIQCKIFIIDDNSPDGTGEIADKLAKQETSPFFKINVLHRKEKSGLGTAYIYGFKIALQGNYTHIMQMDADLSHNPKYIPLFLEAAKNNDFVVGSRYIKGGGTPDWPFYRKVLSRLGNMYVRFFLNSQLHDYTGGFNLYTEDLLRKIPFESISSSGYEFLMELKYQALQYVDSVSEVPIVFIDRKHGKSKLPKNTILKTILLVPRLRSKRVFDEI